MEKQFSRVLPGTNGHGVLLIHGYLSTPRTMLEMGERLNRLGFTVSLPCLSGHCTTMEDASRCTAADWLADCEEAWASLAAQCKDVCVGGLSMGGNLTLILAARHPVRRIVVCAAPMRAKNPMAPIAPLLSAFHPYVGPGGRLPPPVAERPDPWEEGYDGFYTRTLRPLNRLMRMARRALPKVTCPALLVEAGGDNTIDPRSVSYERTHIASTDVRYLFLPESRHLCTIGEQRETLFAEAERFLTEGL